MQKLQKLLQYRSWLLTDGATGTNYFEMGLTQGEPPELWNIDQPEKVLELHRAFIEAGADIILSNSFGGTRNRLKLHEGLEMRCTELNEAAARLARKAAASATKEVIVAGSMGPTGDLYQPMGELSIEAGQAAYAEQAQALAAGGADVLWIETLSSLEEMQAALQGAQSTNLPVVITASFDSKGRTMMGLTPEEFATAMMQQDLAGFGANCGAGTPDLAAAVLSMRQAYPDAIIIAKSNAGVPEFKDGEFVFSGTIDHMADYAVLMRDIGINIIGGCCGTTPEHLKAMHQALSQRPKAEAVTMQSITDILGEPSSVRTPERTTARRRRRERSS